MRKKQGRISPELMPVVANLLCYYLQDTFQFWRDAGCPTSGPIGDYVTDAERRIIGDADTFVRLLRAAHVIGPEDPAAGQCGGA